MLREAAGGTQYDGVKPTSGSGCVAAYLHGCRFRRTVTREYGNETSLGTAECHGTGRDCR